MLRKNLCVSCALILFSALTAWADDPKELTEADYYPLFTLPTPNGVVLEAGGIDLLPDGKLAVSSRRGDIFTFTKPFSNDPEEIQSQRFASGLHEILGLASKDGWLYATQRCEVSRLKDSTGDGRADVIETVCDDWGITGDYHEYAFGSKFDKDGNIWVTLCLTGSFNSNTEYRGWCVRVSADGKMTPTCSGVRSPGGIGMNALGEVFYTDNQGPWNGTCTLRQLKPGAFMGHPGGNKWFEITDAVERPKAEPTSGSRIMTEAKRIPELMPPSIMFPYKKMGQSASGVTCDLSGGKFGPFQNQMFVGDQTFSTVMRCYLEKVNGKYQGACFPFREGIDSGTLPIEMTKQGSMFIGGTNRGWGSRGKKPFCLQRLDWSGKVPFEVHEMRVKPDGFELTFTKPIDPKTAGDVTSYKMPTYTYIYQSSYGSPEVDHTETVIEKAVVGKDNKSVRLYVKGLQIGHVHELHLDGVRSSEGTPLLHQEAYYTLNYLPES